MDIERRDAVAAPYAQEVDACALALTTEDQREDMAGVFEKRPPSFAGRRR